MRERAGASTSRRQALAAAGAYVVLALCLRAVWFPDARLDRWLPPGQWSHDAALNTYLLTHSAPALLRDGLEGLLQTRVYHPTRDTLLLTEPMLGWSLLAWPLLAAGIAPLAAHNVLWLAALAGNALGCFLLARRVTGHAGAAFLAGIPAAFGAYAWFEGPRLQIVFVGAAAVVVLMLERLAREPTWRDALGLAAAFGAQLLFGLYQALFCATLAGLWLVARPLVYGARAAFARGSLLRIAAGLALPLLAASPLLAAYLGAHQTFDRLVRGSEYVAITAPTFRDLTCVYPAASWLWGLVLPCRRDAMGSHFPGVVAGVLAIGGIVIALRGRDPVARHYTVLAAVLTLLMLGPEIALGTETKITGPFELLSRWVPGWKGVRFPARLGGVQTICLGVLGASAAAALARRASRSGGARWAGALVVAMLGAVMVIEVVPAPARDASASPADAAPAYAAFLRDAPGAGAVVELPTKVAVPPDAARDTAAMLASITHGRPIVNGHFGADPHEYFFNAATLDAFPSTEALAAARRLGVRFVVVHGPPFLLDDREHAGAAIAARARAGALEGGRGFQAVAVFPESGVEVYEIATAPPDGAQAPAARAQ